jgi:hypothetical protein
MWTLYFRFFYQHLVCFHHLFHTCYMPRPLYLRYLSTLIIFGEEYKLWNYALFPCNRNFRNVELCRRRDVTRPERNPCWWKYIRFHISYFSRNTADMEFRPKLIWEHCEYIGICWCQFVEIRNNYSNQLLRLSAVYLWIWTTGSDIELRSK